MGNEYNYDETIRDWYGVAVSEDDILYFESMCGHSWGEVLIIYREGDKLYRISDFDTWSPSEVTEEEALQEMLDFEEMMDTATA